MEFTDHQLSAALSVARVFDEVGNTREEISITFPLVLSQGEHRAEDLLGGERVLAVLGLIHTGPNGDIVPAPALMLLKNLSDPDGVRCLRHMFAEKSEADIRVKMGLAGEAAVLKKCRSDLVSLGRIDLLVTIQQVSLMDDSLGYDIVAPMIDGRKRLLEVKASKRSSSAIFQFFLTRNEYEVGLRELWTWALVACQADKANNEAATVIGWCRVQALRPYLPSDSNGMWTEAFVRLPRAALFDGIPRAV